MEYIMKQSVLEQDPTEIDNEYDRPETIYLTKSNKIIGPVERSV